MRRSPVLPLVACAWVVSCASQPEASTPAPAVPIATTAPTAHAPPPIAIAPQPTSDDLWPRVGKDLVACYEAGRRAVPEMVDGKITFHATIDRTGKPACVVPSDDTGLTQEVEDCMRARVARETFRAGNAEWSTALPVVVRGGTVALGQMKDSSSIDTIESRGLAEDLYDVVEALLPDAKECLRGSVTTKGRRVVVVGAEVGSTGAVTCALASSTSPVAPETRRCVESVFAKARFRPPKRGVGLLSVPIEVVRK